MVKSRAILVCNFVLLVGINGQSRSVIVNPVSVNAGEDALMTCDYIIDAGTSVAFVTWQEVDSGGDEIGNVIVSKTGPTTNGRFSLVNDKDLQITNVNITNEGYYRCRIIQSDSNTAGNFEKLTVYYISGDISLTDSADPECNRSITCNGSVTGSPSPNIIFYQDDKLVKTQTTLPLNYLISSSESDSGTYRCEVSNIADTVESNDIQLRYSDPNFELEEQVTVDPNVTVVVRFEDENFETNEVIMEWSSEPPVDDIDNDKATFTFVAEEDDGLTYTITVTVTADCSRSTTKTQTVTVSNPCSADPCQNVGTCVAHDAENYSCICTEDFSGFDCPCCSSCNCDSSCIGLSVGIGFIGFVAGITLVLLVQLARTKIRPKKFDKTRIKSNQNPDTYMEYSPNSGNDNQTYQDLQRKDEAAYVNIKPNDK